MQISESAVPALPVAEQMFIVINQERIGGKRAIEHSTYLL
jgi:hypothetical protein